MESNTFLDTLRTVSTLVFIDYLYAKSSDEKTDKFNNNNGTGAGNVIDVDFT